MRHATPEQARSHVSRANHGRLLVVATSSIKLTRRGFVVIGVGLFILVTLAVPLRGLLREQRDVAQLQQSVVEQKQTIKDLTNRRERLKDPAYLQALARAVAPINTSARSPGFVPRRPAEWADWNQT